MKLFPLLEYIHFNSYNLSRLISLLSEVAGGFKKQVWAMLAEPLCKIIWIWMKRYPHEYVKLCKDDSRFPGGTLEVL